MITIARIELNEDQRGRLAMLTGAKKVVSRKDVTAFLNGCIEAALSIDTTVQQPAIKRGTVTPRNIYFRSLESHLRRQGNHRGADIAARTARELEGNSA